MGLFDFLNTSTGAGTPNFVNPDTGVISRDPGTGQDLASVGSSINQLLKDPNFLQGLGRAGESLSSGDPFGVAFNPSSLINQIQVQKANQELLSKILGGVNSNTNGATAPTAPTAPTVSLIPTPKDKPGPNSVTTKTTTDGTTHTITSPSPSSLNSFGTSTPIEAQPAQPASAPAPAPTSTSGDNSPFFQALFS